MADPSDMINSANAQYGGGNYTAALEGYDMVLAAGVEDAAVYANRGAAFLALGRHDEALESLTKSIEMDEESVNGHVNMGLVLKAMERLEDAAQSFETAQSLDTESYEAFAGASIVLNQLERWSDASEAAERALELRPGDSNAAFQRAIAASGSGVEIDGGDLAIINASENAANVPILLGKQAHVLSVDAASASKYYNLLLEVEPSATNYFNFAITLLTKQGPQAEALAALLQAIEIDPSMHQPLIQAGTLEVQAKQFDEACAHFLQALKVRVAAGAAIEDHSFFYNYAVALLHTQK
jgi:tetratricopeptide (TPR) repeat protein|tara:strand:+ start:92 stop:982 length:891 start_codon:yes stop_codon:yes gene_type:complete